MKDPRVVAFRMAVWRWFVVASVAAQLAYTALVVVSDSLSGRPSFTAPVWQTWAGGVVGIVVLLVPGLWLYVLVWRVWVGPDALRGWDFWGRFVTVPWGSIHTVKLLNFPLLPTARLYSTGTRRVIWLPLFLAGYSRFAELVAEYAGEDHPVTRAVWQRIEEP